MKLCLGTAQFGMNYGIKNFRGKIPDNEITEILNYASNNSITTIDTASAYGNSEAILGKCMSNTNSNFKFITKYQDGIDISPCESIDNSLKSINIQVLYGYLFHNFSIYKKQPDYMDDFIKLKEAGKTKKIGFSLYYPCEAEFIMKNNIPCDIVQIPYNLFDQRFSYLFNDLNKYGIEIHVRSIFLQGLLLMDESKLNNGFISIKDKFKKIMIIANKHNINVATLCLSIAANNNAITCIVIGIDSINNLMDNVECYRLIKGKKINDDDFSDLTVDDENIILPFNWV